jgi:hypothetical protein
VHNKHLLLRDPTYKKRPRWWFALTNLSVLCAKTWLLPIGRLADHIREIRNRQPRYLQSPATTPTSAHILLPLPPEIANMSDGEIEVESPAGYAVLPKEVTDEIGSIKLFNKARPSQTLETHNILTLCSGATRRSRSAISL